MVGNVFALGRMPWLVAAGVMVACAAAVAACDVEDLSTPTAPGPDGEVPTHPVVVTEPRALTSLATEVRDPRGNVVGVGCMSCHALRDGHEVPETLEGLGEVHGGLVFEHGELSCRACHDPQRADHLRLADGTTVEMVEALRLCAQCHGPQARDWEHGSHGGMRGHWDRRRGPTIRNHCVDCHDPHRPRPPAYLPAPPPRDRHLPAGAGDAAEGEDE